MKIVGKLVTDKAVGTGARQARRGGGAGMAAAAPGAGATRGGEDEYNDGLLSVFLWVKIRQPRKP